MSRVPCRVCFFYLNAGFHGTCRKAVTFVTKQAEMGQGTQKLLAAENIIYIKLSMTKTGASISLWKFFHMHLHLVSSLLVPELPLFQFLCGCVLPAGQVRGSEW